MLEFWGTPTKSVSQSNVALSSNKPLCILYKTKLYLDNLTFNMDRTK
jgi:hypothetical protein